MDGASNDNLADKDLLISRVVDGAAGAEDWDAFRALADRSPDLWRELAEAQRTHADLTAALSEAIAIADAVEAPVHEDMTRRFTERWRVVGALGGWAAAAALAMAWTAGIAGDPAPGQSGGRRASLAGVPAFDTASDAFQAYLRQGQEAGRVVGEMPAKVLLEAQPVAGAAGYEVLYLRQIMERAVVSDLYEFGVDERGRPVPVRVTPAKTTYGAM